MSDEGFVIESRPKWLTAATRAMSILMLVLNIAAACGMIFVAAMQGISPNTWHLATIVSMTFPVWVCAMVVLLVLDLIWWRKTALIAIAALLVCYHPIRDLFPVHIHWGMSQKEQASSFSLMTYNVYALMDYYDTAMPYNRQIDYILKKQPDVVCIQEARFLSPSSKNNLTQAQIDSLHVVYPYVLTTGHDFALLSKFPAKPIVLDFPTDEFESGGMAAWRLKIYGKVVNIFSVHLRSLAFTPEDKDAYRDIVKGENVSRQDLKEARSMAVKISDAGKEREEQIRILQRYLGKYGGKNAIVCGDFNDPVGCYGLHLLTTQDKMKQAYSEAGSGPDITYNANGFYFRIDHILYRGDMYPYNCYVGHIKASDHYPLLATFVLE